MGTIAARRYSSCMHGPAASVISSIGTPASRPERLIAQLVPAADVCRRQLRQLPARSGRAVAGRGRAVLPCSSATSAVARRAGKKKLFGKREVLPGVGLYLDGGFGVGKTHLLASSLLRDLAAGPSAPTAFATFGELTQLAGVFGFVECIDLLADYVVVCIDEFELDDPGNTTLISRLLSQLVERGVSVAATSNTLPEQLGEGRFAAQDFLREINTLAAIFTTVRIDGPGLPASRSAAGAGTADRCRTSTSACRRVAGATLDDFDALCAHLATMHPSRYLTLIEGVSAVFITGVHPIDDQNVALRLVSLTDRLYDAGIPVVASGAKLDTIFSDEMLAGGFRKKYLRATSRLLALTTAGQTRAHHHVVVLDAGAEPKRLGAVDGRSRAWCRSVARVGCADSPRATRTSRRVRRRRSSASVIRRRRDTSAVAVGQHVELRHLHGGRAWRPPAARRRRQVHRESAWRSRSFGRRRGRRAARGRDRPDSRRSAFRDRFSSMNAAMFSWRRRRRARQRKGRGGDVGEFG